MFIISETLVANAIFKKKFIQLFWFLHKHFTPNLQQNHQIWKISIKGVQGYAYLKPWGVKAQVAKL